MKIPNKVIVGARIYTVEIVDELENDELENQNVF